jgi:hypothetical protein
MSEPRCPKCSVPMRLVRVLSSMLPPDTGVEPARPGDEPGKFWQWAVRGCHKRGDCRAIQGWLGHRSIARKTGLNCQRTITQFMTVRSRWSSP